jgi:hypothetical protein
MAGTAGGPSGLTCSGSDSCNDSYNNTQYSAVQLNGFSVGLRSPH